MSSYPGGDPGQTPTTPPVQYPPYQPPPEYGGPPSQYGGPTQPSYPAEPPKKSRRGELVRLGVLLAIVVVIGVGFFLFRDRLSNDAASLQPGECFDQPAAGTTLVTDVQRQPCNEPHDAEVFANISHTAAPAASYPPATEFDDIAGDECVPMIQTYTGLSVAQLIERKLDLSYFYPTPDGWRGGDRVVTCYARSSDDSKLTAPIRNLGTATPSP